MGIDVADDPFRLVEARYASIDEVDKYRQRAAGGFLDWERTVSERYYGPPGTVLDIGCGCGREAFALARLGHTVTGIDISEREIAVARDLARSTGCKVDFQRTGGTKLAFPSNTFDYVTLWSQVLGNVPGRENRLALLGDAARVLRPGGMLSLSVHNRCVCEPIAARKGLVQESGAYELEDGDFIERDENPSIGSCYWHYFNKDETTELIRQAGLSGIACDVAPAFGQTGNDRLGIGWDTLLVAVARKPTEKIRDGRLGPR